MSVIRSRNLPKIPPVYNLAWAWTVNLLSCGFVEGPYSRPEIVRGITEMLYAVFCMTTVCTVCLNIQMFKNPPPHTHTHTHISGSYEVNGGMPCSLRFLLICLCFSFLVYVKNSKMIYYKLRGTKFHSLIHTLNFLTFNFYDVDSRVDTLLNLKNISVCTSLVSNGFEKHN